MDETNEFDNSEEKNDDDVIRDVVPVSGMYENWFLEYASYVILERAVPAIEDGFKPVQRRIMHSMKEKDDGRYNKVANIIGHTMQYHPHGDAAIGDAMVNLGQKELLIDTQGNWGDIRTGDSAAAPRYIEARLSKFANHILFNPKTTVWQASYDGRNKEPVNLPVKFPLLLAQGVEGIAVGLATKIMPHNFCELVKASIDVLKNKKVKLYPDFPTGGMADFSNYNGGLKGSRIRVRAKIDVFDKKTLLIKEIPYGTTTTSVIESIIKANDAGKLKIKKVIDNTAKDVEIEVLLPSGVSPDITIDALYAFSDCEVSIAPNACVIIEDKPCFMTVEDILKACTDNTVRLLKMELEIKKAELLEKILFSSLEKIFIENRIYRDIEECETWEAVIETIDKGLEPFKPQFYREITEEDIVRLTEIRIKRISKFDTFKADELMKKLEEDLEQTEYYLANLIEFAINYYEDILEKFGAGRERKTEIRTFDTIDTKVVAASNAKLYMNAKEGFIGTGLKKDEFVCDCSDIDDIIVFMRDGKMKVVKIDDKVFVGKDIIYAGVFVKGDERMVYNMAYVDAKSGATMVKRFQVLGVTRDKDYDLTKGAKGSKVHYFSANPNGEAEVVTVYLTAGCSAKKKVFDYDFSELAIKGRGSGGNRLTKYPVRKVDFKSAGVSTLSGLDIWYDDVVGRLNTDERGLYLGEFNGDDNILVVTKDGSYELTSYELTNRYEPNQVVLIAKFNPKKALSVVHLDGEQGVHYVKRFQIETNTVGKKFVFISESKGSKMEVVSYAANPIVELTTKSGKNPKETEEINLAEFIDVKGWKAIGNKLTNDRVLKIELLDSIDEEEEEEEPQNSEAASDEKTLKQTSSASESDLDVGSTVDLDVKKSDKEDKKKGDDQLGLF